MTNLTVERTTDPFDITKDIYKDLKNLGLTSVNTIKISVDFTNEPESLMEVFRPVLDEIEFMYLKSTPNTGVSNLQRIQGLSVYPTLVWIQNYSELNCSPFVCDDIDNTTCSTGEFAFYLVDDLSLIMNVKFRVTYVDREYNLAMKIIDPNYQNLLFDSI